MADDPLPETCCGMALSWNGGNGVDYNWKSAKCGSCLAEYVQNLGSMSMYTKTIGSSQFTHAKCGGEVKLKPVFHLIEDRTTKVNFGESIIEFVPYCPRHEKEPEDHGREVFYERIKIVDNTVTNVMDPELEDENGRMLERKDSLILKNNFTEYEDRENLLGLLQ